MRQLAIESITARGFRNLASAEIALGPGFNVVYGDNGQGKTNLLEALYVVATSRSFRTHRPLDVRTHGADVCSVRARIREAGLAREQSIGIQRGARQVRVDGKRPPTLAEYAVLTPVVVFHPGSLQLSMGSGSERRRLVDRLSLYREPGSLGDAEAYAKALRARQRVLETRGESTQDLEHWEELVVRHGMKVASTRQATIDALAPVVERTFATLAPPGLSLQIRYERGAPPTADEFRSGLSTGRPRDRARGSATVGPHRDDLSISVGDRVARGSASQGQHRVIVLALELAELELVATARGAKPVLLVDDVSSELDRDRTKALMHVLGQQTGQVVLTTTRRELIETPEKMGGVCRKDFRVSAGTFLAG